jgi:hypothetical protein
MVWLTILMVRTNAAHGLLCIREVLTLARGAPHLLEGVNRTIGNHPT